MSKPDAATDFATMAWPEPLDSAEMLRAAQAETGLTDFGDDDSFREGLDRVVAAIEAENPSDYLRADARARMLHQLTSRLRLAEDLRQHPEIGDIEIEKPVFVMGLPRSGTTVTFDMLALDRRFRWPRDWEWMIPWPAAEAATIDTDPRIAMLKPISDRMIEAAPELAAVHRIGFDAPGECNTGMMYHFSSANYYAEFGVKDHAEWLIEVGAPDGIYRDHLRMVRQMSWKGPKGRWIFKAPQHLSGVGALLETYPDASLVWNHRDPVKAFSSLSSMVVLVQKSVRLDPDPQEVGDMVVRQWSSALMRATQFRKEHPESEAVITDIAHRDIVRDPVEQVRKIYAGIGEDFSGDDAAAVAQFQSGNSKAQRLGKHKHTPEDFGIDVDKVRRDLAPYYDRFGDLLA